MVTPKGYKETELGCIPVEWDVVKIKRLFDQNFASIQTGPFGTVLSSSEYSLFGTPVISVREIRSGTIEIVSETPRVSADICKRLPRYLLKEDDLVFARKGSVERSALVTAREDGYFLGSDGIRLRIVCQQYNPKYLAHFFRSYIVQNYLTLASYGSTMAGLNETIISQLLLAVPPTATEQQAIAMALSDVDKLIDSLENLITKKKAIKQGAMQELLTGRKRLPGFYGKWKERYLYEIGVFLKGRGLSKLNLANEGFPCILYGEIFTTYNNEIKEVVSKSIIKEGLLSQNEDVLLPCSTTTKGIDLAKAVFLRLDGVLLGGDIIVIRNLFKAYNPYFLAAILTNTYQIRIAEISQGITIIHLNASKLQNIKVMLPPTIDEQRAIATILSDMDTEIEALTQKLEKSRQIKQGMMQELLTGRIRLLDTIIKKQKKTKATKAPQPESSQQSHNEHFHEAVILSTVVSLFASEQFPLGRFRRQKLAYLLHRHAQESTQGFLKKAAGPYNPTIRYKDENIALKANYVAERGKGKFVKGEKNSEAVEYFVQWYGTEAIEWLGQFQYRKNDDLEVLTTVAEAIEDLKRSDLAITLEAVKQVIRENPEWRPKLDKDCFNDFKIQSAIKESQKLFG